MTEKTRKSSGPQTPEKRIDEPGRLEMDDRGNVTWHWADDGDLQADDVLGTSARMQALVDPNLDIKQDDDPLNPNGSNGKGLKSGYNPYNSGQLGKQSWKKKKDLRKLSEWIELKKRIGTKRDPEE